MTSREVYLWSEIIGKRLPLLGKWQRFGLALFSLGVVLAERCTLSKVAEQLGILGKADTLERRLQRFLANPALVVQELQVAWAGWVLAVWGDGAHWWLIDETKLRDRLGIMVVSLAYRQHAIPLAWRCYLPTAYPAEGQVGLIRNLFAPLVPLVAAHTPVIVVADRGIGCSSQLVDVLRTLGLGFLFRVQAQTRYRRMAGERGTPLRALCAPGQSWHGRGAVFKKAGWRQVHLHVLWGVGYCEPWCLISSQPELSGWEYRIRYWQEGSFRDWKSDGWHWQRSRVWLPAHAERLLLVLALALAWTLTQGAQAAATPATRALLTRGRRQTFSLFRLGLRALARWRSLREAPLWELAFPHLPLPPPPKTVVL